MERREKRNAPRRLGRGRFGRMMILLAGLLLVFGWIKTGASPGLFVTLYQQGQQQFVSALGAGGFVIDKIRVRGRERLTPGQIADAILLKHGDLILHADARAIQSRLEALPTIRRARVWIAWPDQLWVDLEERKPFALWRKADQLYIIDAQGVVIDNVTKTPDINQDLARFVGEEANQGGMEIWRRILTLPDFARHVAAIEKIGKRRWNLHLWSGIKIILPEEAPLRALHEFVHWSAHETLLEADIVAIDLRLAKRWFVRLTPEAVEKIHLPGKEA